MKETTMKRTMWILGGGIALIVIAAVLFLTMSLKKEGLPAPASTEAPKTSAAVLQTLPQTSTAVSAGEEPESVWALRLVNKDHALPKNFKVELTSFGNNHHFDKRAFSHLQEMLNDARKQGLSPLVCASYRTQDQQQELFDNKVKRYEKQGYSHEDAVKTAKEWVAYPGTSEHQVGLAVDIVSLKYQLLEESQKDTPEAKWLRANCQNYGFILRFPEDKTEITGVGFEPWHFRYVGKAAAQEIMKKGICLEEYLNQA